MAKKQTKKTTKKTTKKIKKTVRKPVTKKAKTVHQAIATSGSVWSGGDAWEAVDGSTYPLIDQRKYTFPTPKYVPIAEDQSEFDRVVSQIEPYCKQYLKFSLIETIEFVKDKWCDLKKFSQDNPVTFGIGFVCVFAAIVALYAMLA